MGGATKWKTSGSLQCHTQESNMVPWTAMDCDMSKINICCVKTLKFWVWFAMLASIKRMNMLSCFAIILQLSFFTQYYIFGLHNYCEIQI